MEDVDLGDALPLRDETTDSSGSHSEDEGDLSLDDNECPTPSEGLSQRLRGSLQRRVTPLVGNLRHSIATSTGVDATTNRFLWAMQRMRSRDDGRSNQDEDGGRADGAGRKDDSFVLSKAAAATLRSSLATAGMSLLHEEKLVLLGHVPLVQPQDEVLFLERPKKMTDETAPWMMKRGDFVRIQCVDDRDHSWLCQIALEKSSADADVLELATPFPGPLLPDVVVHYVPRECLPTQITSPADEAPASDNEEDDVTELRSSLDGWRPSMDDEHLSADDEATPSVGFHSVTSRTSVARDKAAAFYDTLKTRKARLRTSSADYKDKLMAASQVSREKLVVASQISKEKLALASQASKEKLASVVSKEKLAAASQVSKEKLAVAGQASKEKLAVAGQASKEKLVVAGQASKLKMQSWTTSAKSTLKAKMAQRAEQKAAAAAATSTSTSADGSVDGIVDGSVDGWVDGCVDATVAGAPDVFTIGDTDDDDETQNKIMVRPERRVADVQAEEEQLRRELDDC